MGTEDQAREETRALAEMSASTGSRWRLAVFEGRRVYLRDDLFTLHQLAPDGRSNREHMQGGNAPLDKTGKPIELHHMLQREPGPVAEVTSAFHKKNFGIIHINIMKNPSASAQRYREIRPDSALRIQSGVDRGAFNAFRERYWKWRVTVVL
jgi:filamentous hemagglutinin